MNTVPYDLATIRSMAPLLLSITQELVERHLDIEVLDTCLQRLPRNGRDSAARHRLTAERATHLREKRRVEKELEDLGCSVVGFQPFTLRIPVDVEDRPLSVLWTIRDLEHTLELPADPAHEPAAATQPSSVEG